MNIAEDNAGKIWGAGSGWLARLEGGVFMPIAPIPEGRPSLCAARAGGLWIGIERKLLRYTEAAGVIQVLTLLDGPIGSRNSLVFEDSRGRVWFGTFGDGLYLWTGGSFQKVPLSNYDVRSVFEDREGNLWVATAGGGVCRLRPRMLGLLEEANAPSRQTPRTLCIDRRGDIWVVLQTGKLFARRGGQWNAVENEPAFGNSLATCAVADDRGNVWIATSDSDLVHWDGKTFERRALPPKTSGRRIRALLTAPGGELWIGRSDSVVHGWPGFWRVLATPPKAGEVQVFTRDGSGRIWAGTRSGALLLADGDRLTEHTPAELKNKKVAIHALLSTADGALWAGTAGAGLARIKDGRCSLVTSAHGLRHDVVSQLVLDEHGRLWGGGDRGFFLASLEDLNAVADGRAASFHSIGFGRSEGTPSLQANSGYCPNTMLAPDGTLWFATRNGIAVANSKIPGSNREPPGVAIEEMRVDGQPVKLPETSGVPLKLGPGAANVRFDLSAMSFTAPENVQLQHRLDGLDRTWVETSRDRNAIYSYLPPGEYTLRVRAANNDGVWSNDDATLSFTVVPFLWQNVWFQLAVGGVCLAATVFGVHTFSARRMRRHAELLKREAALQSERARIARDMHDQLGASLTQIALLSELAQREMVHRNGAADERLPQLAATARQAVADLDVIVWAVNPRHDNLVSLFEYLGQQAVDFLRLSGHRCRVDFPADPSPHHLPADFRHHLFLIIREALNNIVKYATASEVHLSARVNCDGLDLVIRDNGRGFRCETISDSSEGVRNMRQRAIALGGTCEIESVPRAGTIVSIQVPWPMQGTAA
jgi:signal transduction histidine kinase/streptogramin lyase